MHDHDKRVPDDIDMLRRMGYENRDISYGAIVKWVLALFVFIGVMGGVSMGVYWALVDRPFERNKEWPLRTVEEIKSIPEPRLQARPLRDMAQFRKTEDAKLEKQGFHVEEMPAGTTLPQGDVQQIPASVMEKMEARYAVPQRKEAGPAGDEQQRDAVQAGENLESGHPAPEHSGGRPAPTGPAPAPQGVEHIGGETH